MFKPERLNSFPVILTGNDVIASQFNHQYEYKFPVGTVAFKDTQIAVASVNIFYSWFNIKSTLGNNSFSYTFTTGGGTTTHLVTIPDGFYSISDLNIYLQSVMITNGHYLVDSSGNFVYYLAIVTNSTYYAVQLEVFAFPTALPVGWTNPMTLTFPGVASTPQYIIASNAFRDTIGFNAGTYPAVIQATNYSKISDYTPQVTPIQSILMTCNLVRNKVAIPNSLLYTFTSGDTVFGGLINSAPNDSYFVPVVDGGYTSIAVAFYDQNLNPLSIVDTNLTITLILRWSET